MKGYILMYQAIQVGAQTVSIASGVQQVDCQLWPTDPSLQGAVSVYETQSEAVAAVTAAQSDIRAHMAALCDAIAAPVVTSDATAAGLQAAASVDAEAAAFRAEGAAADAAAAAAAIVADSPDTSGSADTTSTSSRRRTSGA